MSGNSIGKIFTVTTWGESHGEAVGAVVDGCPPGIDIDKPDIQKALDRRRPGGSDLSSPRNETDAVDILSGTFEGKTTGTPILLVVRNADARSGDYDSLRDIFRPGHGDFTYDRKYGIRDHRGGGRASGRETVGRVAAGAIARKVIAREGISVLGYTREIGGIAAERFEAVHIGQNRLHCPDKDGAVRMEEALNDVRDRGDSLGGIVEVLVRGCPAGLGDPVFDKIDADLAKALMGIGTVKGVEIGAGFESARMTGAQCNDQMGTEGFLTNHAGGIQAGITNGNDILVRAACKPIPSIEKRQQTVDRVGRPRVLEVEGRHDVCVIPRIIPVCEAMVAIVLADHLLRQRALR